MTDRLTYVRPVPPVGPRASDAVYAIAYWPGLAWPGEGDEL